MKLIHTFIVFIFILTLSLFSLSYASFAQTIAPSGVLQSASIDINQIKTTLIAGFDEKIATLNQILSQIDANTQLTAEQKAQLKAQVQKQIALLTDLKNKVQQAITVDDLLRIFQDFLLQAISSSSSGGSQLATIQSIQNLIDNLKLQGVDTTQLQSALDQLKATLVQQQQALNNVGNNMVNVKSLGQAIQVLKQWKMRPQKGQSNAVAAHQWTQLLHQVQELKRQNPQLFPTLLPSLFPTVSQALTPTPLPTVSQALTPTP